MKNKDYFLGLDIGTNSVGWAVTDENYNLLNFNKFKTWGIRLFDEANTAEERRVNRGARRRHQRQLQRRRFLKELFAEEIAKVDPNFFIRLKESDLYLEDKSINSKGSLFNDEEWTDEKYHHLYPTVYHLIMDLIENDEKKDIRLVFLACNALIKNRGHFIFEGQNLDVSSSFDSLIDDLKLILSEEPYEIDLKFDNDKLADVLSNPDYGISKKKENLKPLFGKTKLETGVISLVSGGTQDLSLMFEDDELKESDYKKLTFSNAGFDDNRDEYEFELGDRFVLIEKLKEIYDCSLLEKMLSLSKISPDGKKYISSSKITLYEKHKKDLKLLKYFVKKYVPEKYDEVFRNEKIKNNYVSYVKSSISDNKRVKADKFSKKEDFYNYIKLILKDLPENENTDFQETKKYITDEIEKDNFLPKLRTTDNSVMPYQLKLAELKKILDNQSKHYEFLNEVEKGWSVKDKIISLLTFRIPYYVGPLNSSFDNGNSWAVRKDKDDQNKTVTPWNFEEKIDIEQSRDLFIKTKLNECTYLKDELVLPKNSLLYREFMVLNELNNLKVNGELVTNDIKVKIFDELFKSKKKVSKKRATEFIRKEVNTTGDLLLTGIDGDFTQNLGSYLDINKILGGKLKEEKYRKVAEKVINDITLYGDDKKYLKEKLKRDYSDVLSKDEITKLRKLNYSDWGRLSEKFLTKIEGTNLETGETGSIIYFMRNYMLNLMELLSNKFTFLKEIEKFNAGFEEGDSFSFKMLDDLYLSPSVKRMLWQSLKIVDEIKSIMGHDPKRIFVEMARGKEAPERKDSRKKKILELYKSCKKSIIELIGEYDYNKKLSIINEKSESDFRWDNLYLYYTQLGKCMYSLDNIDIDLDDSRFQNIYDQDHIFPKSKIYDDSIENRVLVKKTLNTEKGNSYPISNKVIPDSKRAEVERFWKFLHDKKLIGDKKYERLIRKTPFTDDELGGFIARQMVETRQATKETARLLKKICTDSEIVYVKAGNVSIFRHKFDIPKCRLVNDYHHAHDAYLNIVVGNIYHTKFTMNPYNYIKQGDKSRSYNLEKLFEYDVERNGYVAWKAEDKENGVRASIVNVKKNIQNKNIRFTRMSYIGKGALFDATIVRKGLAKVSRKENSKISDINKYGGFKGLTRCSFLLVEGIQKKKTIKKLVPLTLLVYNKLNNLPESEHKKLLKEYIEEFFNIENPTILIKDIKINTLAKIDGAYYYLKGGLFDTNTNGSLEIKSALQLIVSNQTYSVIKRLEKESKNDFKYIEKIYTKEDLQKVLKELLDKFENSIFKESKILSNKNREKLNDSIDKFIELDLAKQCETILKLVSAMSHSGNIQNIKEIGLGTEVGRIRPVNVVSSYNEFKLINQSITGLFENEIDLLKL